MIEKFEPTFVPTFPPTTEGKGVCCCRTRPHEFLLLLYEIFLYTFKRVFYDKYQLILEKVAFLELSWSYRKKRILL